MSIKLFGRSQIMTKDETLPVIRQGTAIPQNVDYIDGKPVKRLQVTFSVCCNVQPLNQRELLLVPELDRYKEQLWLYFINGSFIVNQGLETESISTLLIQDQVTRLGAIYFVQAVENWGSYARARVMRLDTGANATP